MFNVSFTLTITGLAPQSKIASIVAIKLKACVITSSPGFTPKAFKAILIAAVPDDTAKQNFTLNFFVIKFSNSLI